MAKEEEDPEEEDAEKSTPSENAKATTNSNVDAGGDEDMLGG